MLERYTLIGLAFSLTILLSDLYLLRKRKIQGKGFALWFLIGAVVGLFSTVPYFFELLVLFYGTQELVTAVTVTGFLFFLSLFFYMHYRLTEMHRQLMKLTVELSAAKFGQKQTAQKQTTGPNCEQNGEAEDET